MNTLFYDRLPMVFTFSWLIFTRTYLTTIESIVYIAISFYSLYHWKRSYDLTLYCAIQLSMIIFWFLNIKCGMLLPVLFYTIAKICEDMDKQIYAFTGHQISGHTLKHISSGLALFVMPSIFIR